MDIWKNDPLDRSLKGPTHRRTSPPDRCVRTRPPTYPYVYGKDGRAARESRRDRESALLTSGRTTRPGLVRACLPVCVHVATSRATLPDISLALL
jgi:hypothetical protein